jgi:AraC-like DNA-binding protein
LLEPFVEHFWIVEWSLPDREELEQSTLPHPVVHWTVQRDRGEIVGITRGRFVTALRGTGRVVAVKFHPAGFCAFHPGPLYRLTDQRKPAEEVLGQAGRHVGVGFDRLGAGEAAARLAEALMELEPRKDTAAEGAKYIVQRIAADPSLTTVDAVARSFDLSVLSLQRLFRSKVGVSPKWVIVRYRLHEAMERIIDASPRPFFADLALELGFTDQAHFCRVFKRFVGETPAVYAARVRRQREGIFTR